MAVGFLPLEPFHPSIHPETLVSRDSMCFRLGWVVSKQAQVRANRYSVQAISLAVQCLGVFSRSRPEVDCLDRFGQAPEQQR